MADVERADAADEIDVAPAVDVPHDGARARGRGRCGCVVATPRATLSSRRRSSARSAATELGTIILMRRARLRLE